MGRLSSAHLPLGVHTVIGSATGRAYDCSSLKRLDTHLVDLSERIVRAHKFPGLTEQYRSDQNELLDRRAYLILTTTEET